jgi:type IV pilus assembly protein PilC
MPTFVYEGRTASGKVLRGAMEAPSRQAVVDRLRARRIQPIGSKIREKGQGLHREVTLPALGRAVKPRDVVLFTRQLATMIEAGMPIVQTLDVLSSQTANRALARQIRQVKESVEAGSTLAKALREFPKTWDDLYVSMVRAGETGGILDAILARLSVHMEKMVTLKRKVRGALIYPAAIVAVAVIVCLILLVFVIPVFAELFSSFDRALPLPTQVVIAISDATMAGGHLALGGAIVAAIAVRQLCRTERGRAVADRVLLATPIVGELLRKASVARFSRTLGTLISAGVPILDALAITSRTAGNKVVEKAALAVRESVGQGRTMLEPMLESGVFPPLACQMVGAGELTGAIDPMLQKVADFYEGEVDLAVANLTALMEPLVIVVLGGLIGGIVVSMYLPIFQLGSLLSS